MRKKRLLVYVLLFVLCIVGVLVIFLKKKIDITDYVSSNINHVSENIENTIKEQEAEEYVDDNPIKIGLYIDQGDSKRLVKNYTCDYTAENVMGLFYALPTQEEIVSGDDFKQVFESYMNQYELTKEYKIGYYIKFTLASGEVIEQRILNPDDAYLMFPKVQFYLYDDVNLIPGRPYYHITQDIMTEDRICSSAKLVGDKNTKDIVSPIEFTVFTFDSEDDFDPITKRYRGNSSYTIYITEE